MDALRHAAAPLFLRADVTGFYAIQYESPTAVRPTHSAPSQYDPLMADMHAHTKALGVDGFRRFHFSSPVITQLEALELVGHPYRDAMAEARTKHRLGDGVAVIAHPTPGVVAVLYALSSDRIVLAQHERKQLARLAVHLDAGWRLRGRPELVRAELTPDGRVLHREKEGPTNQAMQTYVRRVGEAKRKKASGGDAIDLWAALVAGQASLISRGGGKSGRYLIVDNPPERHAVHALSTDESATLSLLARGVSTKLAAYGLGISSSAVSTRINRAATKIGALSRTELLRVAAILNGDPRAASSDAELSPAESDIRELLQKGLTNREIAALRSRSLRTIANQVAKLLKKTGASSRRQLLG